MQLQEIHIKEVRRDSLFYLLFTFIANPSLNNYLISKEAKYFIDPKEKRLYTVIDDIHTSEQIHKLDLTKKTFNQRKHKYHFDFI